MQMSDEMVSHTEAAAELGVSVPTFYRWLKTRKIRTYRRVGDRHGYVRRDDLAQIRDWYPKDATAEGKAVASLDLATAGSR
jgi:excisionase family DNA binding protein